MKNEYPYNEAYRKYRSGFLKHYRALERKAKYLLAMNAFRVEKETIKLEKQKNALQASFLLSNFSELIPEDVQSFYAYFKCAESKDLENSLDGFLEAGFQLFCDSLLFFEEKKLKSIISERPSQVFNSQFKTFQEVAARIYYDAVLDNIIDVGKGDIPNVMQPNFFFKSNHDLKDLIALLLKVTESNTAKEIESVLIQDWHENTTSVNFTCTTIEADLIIKFLGNYFNNFSRKAIEDSKKFKSSEGNFLSEGNLKNSKSQAKRNGSLSDYQAAVQKLFNSFTL